MMLVVHGRNTVALEQPWSMIVRIASFPLCIGRPVIRSITTCWNGRALFMVLMWNGGTLPYGFVFCFVDMLHILLRIL